LMSHKKVTQVCTKVCIVRTGMHKGMHCERQLRDRIIT